MITYNDTNKVFYCLLEVLMQNKNFVQNRKTSIKYKVVSQTCSGVKKLNMW